MDEEQKEIRFLDLFGGVGGFRLGLERANYDRGLLQREESEEIRGNRPEPAEGQAGAEGDGGRFRCAGYIDSDKFCVRSYNAIFGEEHEPRDAREVPPGEIPGHDLLCAGFPCQSFSIAGERKGLEDTRGTLFFEIARIAGAKEPEVLLLENVRGLLSHDEGLTFQVILESLDELGYFVEWQVLNSKRFGVPQNRERVFIVGHLGGEPRRKVFPLRGADREADGEDGGGSLTNKGYDTDMSKPEIGEAERVYGGEGVSPPIKNHPTVIKNHRNREIREHGKESPTINKKQGGGHLPMVVQSNQREEWRIKRESGSVHGSMASRRAPKVAEGFQLRNDNQNKKSRSYGGKTPTIDGSGSAGVRVRRPPDWLQKPDDVNPTVRKGGAGSFKGKDHWDVCHDGARIRRLTPRECWRLQGFPDWAFERAERVNSDTQLYKQAGNAVTVNVVEAIGRSLLRTLDEGYIWRT